MRKLFPLVAATALVSAFAMSLLTIDWSSFGTALAGVVPDAVALAAILVGGAITIAVVFKGGRAAVSWATRWVR
jgi:hypothetical protein